MGTIVMSSKNSKTFEPNRLVVNLTDKELGIINVLLNQILVPTLYGKI